MPDTPITAATLRGQKTRRNILKNALKLFATKGYKATTVRDIAAAVGIKQGALYNHFKNKDEILETLIEELTSSAVVHLFDEYDPQTPLKSPKSLLMGIATKFKLMSFDAQNEALFKLLMQEIYRNERIREIYNEHFYQENVKKLSGIFFNMMQNEQIRSADPLLLAHEFFSPLFFYQMQVSLLKIDKKSTSSVVTLFEKHVDTFWDCVKIERQESLFG
jgi:AcrR family transcriptional regulator